MKTIQIDDVVHARAKAYCDKFNMKLNRWVESILITVLDQDDRLERELPAILENMMKKDK